MMNQAIETLNATAWARGFGFRELEIIKLRNHEATATDGASGETVFHFRDGSKLTMCGPDDAHAEAAKNTQ